MLRRDTPEAIERPQPGAGDLGRLVEGFRGAGTSVEVVVRGDPGEVGPSAGLTVYRIAQEALTNAAKHAPGAPVNLELDIADREIALVVASSGPPREGTGLGLDSMRERAEAVGGSCVAGPCGDGWTVRALIPVAS
jgi:signal transduction histidine kinase